MVIFHPLSPHLFCVETKYKEQHSQLIPHLVATIPEDIIIHDIPCIMIRHPMRLSPSQAAILCHIFSTRVPCLSTRYSRTADVTKEERNHS